MINHIKTYFEQVKSSYILSNTETAYNKPIIDMLIHFGVAARDMSGRRSGNVGENIDIELWRDDEEVNETSPFAGIEVKKIKGIDKRAKKQIKKEADIYGYAILTDNLEWRFWRANEDEMYTGVQLIDFNNNGELVLLEENVSLFIGLMQDFLLQDPTNIKSSTRLAEYMATHAKTIRTVIFGILKEDGEDKTPLVTEVQKNKPMFSELFALYKVIKKDLRPLLNTTSFADMYAQTIVYGLFIARYNDKNNITFDRYTAIGKLTKESALLNKFFTHIATSDKKYPTLDKVIDKLCNLYKICDIDNLLNDNKRGDTIVHFYEDFLTYYDAALRKRLGVFYTPQPIVKYLVKMVDKFLIEEFNIKGGLSNNETIQITVPSEPYKESNRKNAKTLHEKDITVPKVAILDPACGTGTFHAEIIKYVKETYFSGGKSAFYSNFINDKNGLLSRIIGFEIMMTSYVVAHLNIKRTVAETMGHDTTSNDIQPNIYLTNTLASAKATLERDSQITLFNDFSGAITDESYKADTYKLRRPIKVIIGNPPYLTASTNPFDISLYRLEVDGITSLQERNSKPLNDDYVKFFAFSENIINRNEEGILAFVSNNGFLENPTFRGMRASLLRTFDKIYIVDLHGNSNKQEKTPTGEHDENVFDIKTGVSLFIGVKTTNSSDWASVYHTDLYGKRIEKFDFLNIQNFRFTNIEINKNMAYLAHFKSEDNTVYENGINISNFFVSLSTGIATARDHLCIQNNVETVNSIIRDFQMNSPEKLRDYYDLGKDTQEWSVVAAKADIEMYDGEIVPILYRPFDVRMTYYTGRSKGFHCRPRGDIMKQMLKNTETPIGKNIALVFGRRDTTQNPYAMVYISNLLIDSILLNSNTSGSASIAPLYIFNNLTNSWEPNFNSEQLTNLTAYIHITPTPIQIFDYIYAILHDPNYRTRFNDLLKRDFPRVPIINNINDKDNTHAFYVSEDKFNFYVEQGEKLRKIHLMEAFKSVDLELIQSEDKDMNIYTIKYKDGILKINDSTLIKGISKEVWSFRIGGYQVLDKWFKSHKGQTLTLEKFEHIQNVSGVLNETIEIQKRLQVYK